MRIALLLVALSAFPAAQAGVTLPAGVKSVSFGQAQRYDAGGKEFCAIVKPLSSPAVFERGVTEMSYAVELEPRVVNSASARVVAPEGSRGPQRGSRAGVEELRASGCNAFTPIKGGFSQTQLGSTLTRVDKAPLPSGRYTLRITVDGQTADITFTIK